MKSEKTINEPFKSELRAIIQSPSFHIVITGEVQKGKSTLLRNILKEFSLTPTSGFITERIVGKDGIGNGVYINSVNSPKIYTKENMCALYGDVSANGKDTIKERYTCVFETKGVEFLAESDTGLVVMDEIGFLERDAALFLSTIDKMFESNRPLIAVIKKKDIDYLTVFKNKKGNRIITVLDGYKYDLAPV